MHKHLAAGQRHLHRRTEPALQAAGHHGGAGARAAGAGFTDAALMHPQPNAAGGDDLAEADVGPFREAGVAAKLAANGAAGAYGMAQSSNYNSRGRPAEVLVQGDGFRTVRRREHINDQLALERLAADG